MFFKTIPIEVYRYTPPPSNWGDPTVALIGTYQATVQPFTADDGLHDNQMFSNVRELLIFTDPYVPIEYGDVLKYRGKEQRIAYILRFDNGVLPHCEIYIASTPMTPLP